MLVNNLFLFTMKYKFDMIFLIKAAQNMVAEHFMNTILTDFPPQGNNMKSILT